MEYTVAAVDEALGLLLLVATTPDLGVTELARRSGNTKARAYRLLTTLEGRNFVERHGDPAVYRLGTQSLMIGLAANEQIGLVTHAQRHLDQLREQFNETTQLRIMDGLETVCVAVAESTRDLRVSTHIGRRRPLYAGSSGKVMLAFGTDELRKSVMEGAFQKFTGNTLSKTKLNQELVKVRAQGYATSSGEFTSEVTSIAAPVRDASGSVIATIVMSVPDTRAGEKALKGYIAGIVKQAALLSKELGYSLKAVV
jgi:IclR family KDG regulon transcriptional repressor